MCLKLTEFTDLKEIGSGAAADVYKGKYKYTDVAIKKLKAQHIMVNRNLAPDFQREIEALSRINHPNVVHFLGATAD